MVQAVNAVNKTKAARGAMDSVLGVHPDAWMPELAAKRFRWAADKQGSASTVVDGARAPGKVAIFATCCVNYNEPGIGHDLLKVLEHNAIPYLIVEKESCCGMPKLELGDLKSVDKHKDDNIPVLVKYARDGYAILSAIPSCTLMFKQALPLMFPDEADVQFVKDAMFDPFEYLMARHKDGLLQTDFKRDLGKVSYHIPCLRKSSKREVIAHRRLRSVQLGEQLNLQFEDEHTVRRQIQEMLHIEKIFDEAGIQSEIEAYAALVPDGSNWKATMLIEYPDPHERKRELGRENEVKTSAVHFGRFEFDLASKQAVRSGAAVKLGCDHAHYPAHVSISPETLASPAGDLRLIPRMSRRKAANGGRWLCPHACGQALEICQPLAAQASCAPCPGWSSPRNCAASWRCPMCCATRSTCAARCSRPSRRTRAWGPMCWTTRATCGPM